MSLQTFIVNTAILRPRQDPKTCATGAPQMLLTSGVKDIRIRSCYCCSEYGSVVFVLDANSSDDVLRAFSNVNVPVASIMAAEEMK